MKLALEALCGEHDNLQISSCKRLVAQICVILESKSKFAVTKIVCRRRAVVQPLKKLSPREESLVKAAHDFWIGSRDISSNSTWLARFALFLVRVADWA